MLSMNTTARARSRARWLTGSPAAVALLALVVACSNSSNATGDGGSSSGGGGTCPNIVGAQPPAGTCSSKGGPIDGPNNGHCVVGGVQQVQATGACITVGSDAEVPSSGDDASGGDGASSGDGSAMAVDAGDNGECGESGYGVTNYGTSAQDDDCKYDVSYTATPICQNTNVYFTVIAKKRAGADGGPSLSNEAPLTGASVSVESYNDDCMTIAMISNQTTVDQGNGSYKVGPIQFQKSGKWIVRFHFNGCCSDIPADSPHGHAAFWVNVP
jgi:hypothetical protein